MHTHDHPHATCECGHEHEHEHDHEHPHEHRNPDGIYLISPSSAVADPAQLDLQRVEARGTYLEDGIAGVRTTIAAGPPGTRQLSTASVWARTVSLGVALASRMNTSSIARGIP